MFEEDLGGVFLKFEQNQDSCVHMVPTFKLTYRINTLKFQKFQRFEIEVKMIYSFVLMHYMRV